MVPSPGPLCLLWILRLLPAAGAFTLYRYSLLILCFCFYPVVLLDQECADHAADDGNGCQDSRQLEGLFVFLNQLENYCCDCQGC